MAIERPAALFDRVAEWDDIVRFATEPTTSSRIGVVSGRRRQGKSFILDAVTRGVGGFYLPTMLGSLKGSSGSFGPGFLAFAAIVLGALALLLLSQERLRTAVELPHQAEIAFEGESP